MATSFVAPVLTGRQLPRTIWHSELTRAHPARLPARAPSRPAAWPPARPPRDSHPFQCRTDPPPLPVPEGVPTARVLTIPPPRPLTTRLHLFRDARRTVWTYESDELHDTPPCAVTPMQSPIVLVHAPGTVGASRRYWDHALVALSSRPRLLHRHRIASFDWVGTAASSPKPHVVDAPYDCAFCAAQLADMVKGFGQAVVLVAQGQAEHIVVRLALQHPQLVRALVIANSTDAPRPLLNGWKYDVLKKGLGMSVWNSVSKDAAIKKDAAKRLRDSHKWGHAWALRTSDAKNDPLLRFHVLSKMSGAFYHDAPQNVEEVSAPTLFLAGGDPNSDKVDKVLKRRCDRFADSRSVVVDGSERELFFEDPSVALEAVGDFLQTLY